MVFQTSVQIQPGNNGGPFLNQSEQFFSISQARLDSKVDIGTLSTLTQNVNYSIKSSFISSLLPILQETLFASRGIVVVPIEPENSMSNFIYRTKKILF